MLLSRLAVGAAGSGGRAQFALTDRHGGYSTGPHGSLNLARHVGDDPAAVAANRSLLGSALGLSRVSYVSQVHGTHVHEVTAEDAAALTAQGGEETDAVSADAQVTRVPGVGLAVLVADCTPVLLADPAAGVAGVAHAGRAGMAAGVIARVVEAMRDLGATELSAVIGPSISSRRYEVPAALRAEVAAVEPVTAAVSLTGTPALDVAAGTAEQLHRHGVRIAHWSSACTYASEDLYSYRRDGVTGRFAGLAWLD
ncbi:MULTISPECIES: peptidoglycan editing factor PgeF [Brevibacterium]|uniref:Purine nucleoside phosphorylase n=1 Tax=Brevibacterium salitolerans TaxID=1403566 RepID=A0ABN2X7B5_9MICO|nr:peptidoglycan editing factor PgeF [Brevibacterium sp.]